MVRRYKVRQQCDECKGLCSCSNEKKKQRQQRIYKKEDTEE